MIVLSGMDPSYQMEIRNQKLCMVTPFNATSIELGIPASLFPTRSYNFLNMTLKVPFGILNTIPTSQENFPSSSPSTLWLPLDKHSVSPIAPKIGNPRSRSNYLAATLSPRRDLLLKYDTLINQVKFSPPPDPIIIFTPAVKDSHNHGIPNPDSTYYNMFVDDSLYVHIDSVIRQSMAASIEALYMILGYPDKPCAKMLSVWTNSYNSSALSSVISSVCYSTHDR